MQIVRLSVTNFKGLKNIELNTDKKLNVIVGPNAVGKSTLLEAIRLVKCTLSPRYNGELVQALVTLGALSQNYSALGPKGFDYGAIANDPSQDIVIGLDIKFSQDEISKFADEADSVAVNIMLSSFGREDNNQFALTQLLSTDDGRKRMQTIKHNYVSQVTKYSSSVANKLRLTIRAGTANATGNDIFLQNAVMALDRALPPQRTLFSYFPADRAFPQGEIAIQLGSGDAQNQIQSHMGQPVLKYGRLKVAMAQSLLIGELQREKLEADFESIFTALLPGKKFEKLSMNEIGLVRIMIQDIATSKSFDIDSLSSGEKGLVSTFLLAKLSLATGSVLLLDEPELHLNPAVTRFLLDFIRKEIGEKFGCQVFICTHSAEILSDAYGSDDAALFHLRTGTNLTPVYSSDHQEVLDILAKLGASTSDVLFSKGNIFVEGPHDDEILSEGFGRILTGYKIKSLGGRTEVEKSIKELGGITNGSDRVKLFILDRDRKPVSYPASSGVLVRQWQRYCLENYLLDEVPLFNTLRENSADSSIQRGEFGTWLKQEALLQIDRIASQILYNELEPENPGMRRSEVRNKQIPEIAALLSDRLEKIKSQMSNFNKTSWQNDFISRAEDKKRTMLAEWEGNWKTEADGKSLIDSIYEKYTMRVDKLTFKKKIIKTMMVDQTETWRSIDSILRDALSSNP